MTEFSRAVREVVAGIPVGRVASYGDVAEMAGRPGAARAVGSVLSTLGDTELPWWRVVGSGGRITTRRHDRQNRVQQALLEDEGVEVDEDGRIPWSRYRWRAPE